MLKGLWRDMKLEGNKEVPVFLGIPVQVQVKPAHLLCPQEIYLQEKQGHGSQREGVAEGVTVREER